ncbi:MAG: hypothetical protein JZU65_22335, partial [Chlorobium sp.]|nr:hypothetical protein [Chlorobium sp.]
MTASKTVTKPKYLDVKPSDISNDLKAFDQWVNWEARWVAGANGKPGRWAKIPCQPNGQNA